MDKLEELAVQLAEFAVAYGKRNAAVVHAEAQRMMDAAYLAKVAEARQDGFGELEAHRIVASENPELYMAYRNASFIDGKILQPTSMGNPAHQARP